MHKNSLTFKSNEGAKETAIATILASLEPLGIDRKVIYKIRLALDELLENVTSYAYDGDEGDVRVDYEISDEPRKLTISIIDQGKPFDPTAVDTPDLTMDISDRPIGGLGIYLVKSVMDQVSYKRIDNQNVLTIEKNI